MQRWAAEDGALWALETENGLPPPCAAQVDVAFAEVGDDEIEALAAAMDLASAEPVRQRLSGPAPGKRRCFTLRVSGEIAAYGWVTQGVEVVGELERRFNLHEREAYIWDCRTLPAWRRKGLYSALLSQIIVRLHEEDTPRIWIGASQHNRPSIRGFANAGFEPVIELAYRRLYRLTLMWITEAERAPAPQVAAAYRILINEHERRVGRLVVGIL